MELKQAIELIQCDYILSDEKTLWADFGCGSGLFTNALAHFLKTGSKIFAIDKNINAFKNNEQSKVIIEKIKADFVNDGLKLENLSGIIMANSLHYVKDKLSFIKKAEKYFRNTGCFLIVEYDTDIANPWVPYPVSFNALKIIFSPTFYSINKINEMPSRYNRSKIYSAIITK